MMKLWILRPIAGRKEWDPWYDKTFGFVVRADTEMEARRMANEDCGDEGKVWDDPEITTCKRLYDEGEAGILMNDFSGA